jgi:hypothetical protein
MSGLSTRRPLVRARRNAPFAREVDGEPLLARGAADASCLFETLTRGPCAGAVDRVLSADPDHAAPRRIDAEVFGVVRGQLLRCRVEVLAPRQR